MRKIILLMSVMGAASGFAQKTTISASEDDARIIVNGQLVGSGTYVLKTDKSECYNVKVQKVSFLKYVRW